MNRKSLFKLQRLSKRFFALATAEIYSDLDFHFTISDSKDSDTPFARLSDALQTIVSSDQDYARHIKRFRTSISPENHTHALMMMRILWGADLEPSKLLNTMLLLLLRKAKAMETFQ